MTFARATSREIKTEYNMKNITLEITESVRDLRILLDNKLKTLHWEIKLPYWWID